MRCSVSKYFIYGINWNKVVLATVSWGEFLGRAFVTSAVTSWKILTVWNTVCWWRNCRNATLEFDVDSKNEVKQPIRKQGIVVLILALGRPRFSTHHVYLHSPKKRGFIEYIGHCGYLHTITKKVILHKMWKLRRMRVGNETFKLDNSSKSLSVDVN